MNRKRLIIIFVSAGAAALLAVAGIFIFGLKGFRRFTVPPRVAVSYPDRGGAAPQFMGILVPGIKKETSLYIFEEILPAESYTRLLPEKLQDPLAGDLFYTPDNNLLHYVTALNLSASWDSQERKTIEKVLPEAMCNLSNDSEGNSCYLPVTWYPWGIYYRKSVFTQLGLSVPESWEDFLNTCKVLKENDYDPIAMISQVRWPLLVWFDYLDIRINGPEFHKAFINLEIPFNDERVRNVFEVILELIEQDYMAVDYQSPDWEGQYNAVKNGKAVMVLSGNFFYDRSDEQLKQDLGWFSFPVVDNRTVKSEIIASSGFIISRTAPKRENIGILYEYVLSENFQDRIFDGTGLFPVNEASILKLERDDAVNGYLQIENAEILFAMTERIGHPQMLIPFKEGLSRLVAVHFKSDIDRILQDLENIRQDILQ